MWDLIVSVPDHCLSFYSDQFTHLLQVSKKSLSSLILYNFFLLSNTCIKPRGRGHTAPKGQSFDVNRNFLSFRSSVPRFKS